MTAAPLPHDSPPPLPSASDLCGVCRTARGEHGDRHHVFSTEGRLEAVPPPARRPPDADADSPPAPSLGTTDHGVRVALITAGLLSVEQLQDADDLVRAAAGQMVTRHSPAVGDLGDPEDDGMVPGEHRQLMLRLMLL